MAVDKDILVNIKNINTVRHVIRQLKLKLGKGVFISPGHILAPCGYGFIILVIKFLFQLAACFNPGTECIDIQAGFDLRLCLIQNAPRFRIEHCNTGIADIAGKEVVIQSLTALEAIRVGEVCCLAADLVALGSHRNTIVTECILVIFDFIVLAVKNRTLALRIVKVPVLADRELEQRAVKTAGLRDVDLDRDRITGIDLHLALAVGTKRNDRLLDICSTGREDHAAAHRRCSNHKRRKGRNKLLHDN